MDMKRNMNEVPFQEIYDILCAVMPEEWSRVVFFAQYGQGSYEMEYFVDQGDGKYTDCFDLNGISENDIIAAFSMIDQKLRPVREWSEPKDLWSVMTICVDSQGHFKADFEYEDVSDDFLGYYDRWKERYLK